MPFKKNLSLTKTNEACQSVDEVSSNTQTKLGPVHTTCLGIVSLVPGPIKKRKNSYLLKGNSEGGDFWQVGRPICQLPTPMPVFLSSA